MRRLHHAEIGAVPLHRAGGWLAAGLLRCRAVLAASARTFLNCTSHTIQYVLLFRAGVEPLPPRRVVDRLLVAAGGALHRGDASHISQSWPQGSYAVAQFLRGMCLLTLPGGARACERSIKK